jgi:hypothetical protein
MEDISRRDMFRLAGGAGASALVGTALVAGDDLPGSAAAAPAKKVIARLDKVHYRAGEVMTLRILERLAPGRRIRVTDSTGARWKRVARAGKLQKWKATAKGHGGGWVTVHVLWPDGRVVRNDHYRARVHYRVVGPTVLGAALIGMSAPASEWDQRVHEVGPGLAARRIYADLAAGPTSGLKLVDAAHKAGLLPVISYKVGGDVAGAMSGTYNAAAQQAAAKLAAYGRPTAVTVWHEPNPDISGADYAAVSKQLLPVFRRGELRVGPILNGWLLDNRQDDFVAYCPEELFGLWDWFGIDTYESGTMSSPGSSKPADRVPALRRYLHARGHDLPLGVGEYNGYSATTISAAGEALMSTPNVWFGCLWNSSGGKGVPLSGDRLSAFQQTLADPRSAQPRLSADDRRDA